MDVWYNADVIGGLLQANNHISISQFGRDLAVHLHRDISNEDLDEKEKKMVQLGLTTLDELGAAEVKEKEDERVETERRSAEEDARSASLAEPSNLLECPFLDAEAMAGLPESFRRGRFGASTSSGEPWADPSVALGFGSSRRGVLDSGGSPQPHIPGLG